MEKVSVSLAPVAAGVDKLSGDAGNFGVLDPMKPLPKGSAHSRPEMKIEVLGNKVTWAMILAVWISFILALVFLVLSHYHHIFRTGTSPPAPAAAYWGVAENNLIGVANNQPFVNAEATELFDFLGAVCVLPPDITTTANDGSELVALQWFGRNGGGSQISGAASTFTWRVEYVDNNGMELSGEDVFYDISAFGCWKSCQDSSNWHAVYTPSAPTFQQKIHVTSWNAAGKPTAIYWNLMMYQEYMPASPLYSFGFKYKNDPGDTAAGYSVFSLNSDGYFGSCNSTGGARDSESCLRLKMDFLENENYSRNRLAMACLWFTVVSTLVWIYLMHRAGKGWRDWNAQQRWTLLMAVGVILFENPVQTFWMRFGDITPYPNVCRALESTTASGLAVLLLVAALWADSARSRVLSPGAFYIPKLIYIAVTCASFYLGLLAVYPIRGGSSGSGFWATSGWSWNQARTLLFIVPHACRLALWMVGGLYYYYFLHCSFRFYNKVPYMLTRAEQLSFRFFTSTFSFFVCLAVLTVFGDFVLALLLNSRTANPGASPLQNTSAFFRVLYGQTLRSPIMAAFLATSVLILQYAFLPAGALQYSQYKPTYVRLERDLAEAEHHNDDDNHSHAHSAREDFQNVVAGAANAATAVAGAVTAAAAATAVAAADVATGREVHVVDTINAVRSVDTPLFVVERARWLAGLSVQAYSGFTEEEFVATPEEGRVDLAPLGCELVELIMEPPESSLHDTHCIVARHIKTRRLVLSFRGTASTKQIKTDLQQYRATINLDLFAQRIKKKWCGKQAPEVQPDAPSALPADPARTDEELGASPPLAPPQQQPQLRPKDTSGFYSTASDKSRRASKRSHIAVEDRLPHYLQNLASMLKGGESGDSVAIAGAVEASESAPGQNGEGGVSEGETQAEAGVPQSSLAADGFDGAAEGAAGAAGTEEASAAAEAAAAVAVPAAAAAEQRPKSGKSHQRVDAALAAKAEAARAMRARVAAMHERRLQARKHRASRGKIHFGFWSSYGTVRERLLEVVKRELLREPGQLYVTGHSLGGALATLCSYDMSLWLLPVVNAQLGRTAKTEGEEHEQEIKLAMYNFGSPRVGDLWFSQRFNAKVPHAYRVVCDGDIITAVPPARFGYVHVGSSVIIDRSGSGSLMVDPSVLEHSLKASAATKASSHMMNMYNKALDGCLYPLDTPEQIQAVVHAVYKGRTTGHWYGCACFFLCCDARLPQLLGCHRFSYLNTKGMGGREGGESSGGSGGGGGGSGGLAGTGGVIYESKGEEDEDEEGEGAFVGDGAYDASEKGVTGAGTVHAPPI